MCAGVFTVWLNNQIWWILIQSQVVDVLFKKKHLVVQHIYHDLLIISCHYCIARCTSTMHHKNHQSSMMMWIPSCMAILLFDAPPWFTYHILSYRVVFDPEMLNHQREATMKLLTWIANSYRDVPKKWTNSLIALWSSSRTFVAPLCEQTYQSLISGYIVITLQ